MEIDRSFRVLTTSIIRTIAIIDLMMEAVSTSENSDYLYKLNGELSQTAVIFLLILALAIRILKT
jgi:hypothetical protein